MTKNTVNPRFIAFILNSKESPGFVVIYNKTRQVKKYHELLRKPQSTSSSTTSQKLNSVISVIGISRTIYFAVCRHQFVKYVFLSENINILPNFHKCQCSAIKYSILVTSFPTNVFDFLPLLIMAAN